MNSGKCSFTTVGASSGLNPGQERGSLARMWSERGELACDFCTSWWPRAAGGNGAVWARPVPASQPGPQQQPRLSPGLRVRTRESWEGSARARPWPADSPSLRPPRPVPVLGKAEQGPGSPSSCRAGLRGLATPTSRILGGLPHLHIQSHRVPGVCVWIVGDPAQSTRGH